MKKQTNIEQEITIIEESFHSMPAYYESIIQNSNDAIIGKDLNGIITTWNKAAEKLYGYSAQEIIGKPITTLVPADRHSEIVGILNKLKKAETIANYETVRVTKEGKYLHVSVTISPIISADGKVKGASAIARDITAQRAIARQQEFMIHASTALASSLNYNKTLQTVADLAVEYIADWCAVDMLVKPRETDLVAVAHKNPKMVEWGRELRKIYPVDFDAPQGLGNVIRTRKPELYPYISEEIIRASIKSDKDYKIIEKIGMKSAMTVPIIIRNKSIGAITFISSHEENLFDKKALALAEDLARRAAQAIDNALLLQRAQEELEERKKIEQALRISEERFKRLLDSNLLGVIVAKTDGRIVEANNFFLDMIGYTQKDLEQDKIRWDALTPEKWLESDAQAIEELRVYGTAGPWEKEYLHKNGKPVPVLLGCTMLDPKEEAVLTFVLDISERKEIEQRKDDFISVASHELKTPITSMKVFTQLLSKRFEKKQDEPTVSLINKMDTQLNKLIVLVSDLLDVSRIHAGKLELRQEDFSLDELVKETIESLEQTTTHQIIFKNGKSILVHADRERIGQVITNFLTNAIKYSPPNKEIIVTVKKDKNSASVGVKDFGIGIGEEEQKRIFERFYQAKSSYSHTYPGLGMGLYICSEIIQRHGGKIKVESKKGEGSHFIFTIPLLNS